MNADEQMTAAVLASYQDAVDQPDADAVRAAYGVMFGAIKRVGAAWKIVRHGFATVLPAQA